MAIESMKTTTLFHHEEETMKRNKRKTPVPKEKHTTFFQGPHLVLGSFWLNLYPNGDTKSTTSTPTSATTTTTTTSNFNSNTLGSASHKSRVYQRRSKKTQKQGVNQRAYATRKSLESEREKEKTEHDVAETLAELKQILSSSEASDDEYTEPNSSFYQTVPTHPSSSTTAINALTTTTSNLSGHHHHHHHHGNSIVNLARNHDGLSENVTSSANFFSQNGTLLSMTDMDLDTDASFLSEIDHEQENEFDRDADDEQSSHDNHVIKQDSLVPFILVKPKNKIGRPRSSSIHQSSSSHHTTMASPPTSSTSFSSPSSQVEKKIAKVKTSSSSSSSSSTSSSSGKSKGGARVSSHKNQPIQKSGGPCFFCSTTVSTYWRNKYSHKVCNPCGIRLTKYNVWCPGCRYVPNKEECKGTCGTCGKKYVSF